MRSSAGPGTWARTLGRAGLRPDVASGWSLSRIALRLSAGLATGVQSPLVFQLVESRLLLSGPTLAMEWASLEGGSPPTISGGIVARESDAATTSALAPVSDHPAAALLGALVLPSSDSPPGEVFAPQTPPFGSDSLVVASGTRDSAQWIAGGGIPGTAHYELSGSSIDFKSARRSPPVFCRSPRIRWRPPTLPSV